MRKLTVKNFSVIKDAELEFGKITVLIGPQSSGKSLLCKLAYFLGKQALEQAVDSIVDGKSLDEFKQALARRFLERFSFGGLLKQQSSVKFTACGYTMELFGTGHTLTPDISVKTSGRFESLYFELRKKQDLALASGKSRQNQQDETWTELNLLLSSPHVYESLYMPAGRAYFVDPSRGFSALQNTDLDPIVRQFASEVAWGDRWRPGLVTAGDDVLLAIRTMMIEIAKGNVVVTNNVPTFVALDGRHLPLTLLSSGTQELLPMFNVLDRLASFQEHREVSIRATRTPPFDKPPVQCKKLIYLEEPESNVFPSTQYDLVRLFAWLSNEPNLDFSWVITTHSPYILSSFNNLLEAWQVATTKPDSKNEVAKLIQERYWIRPSDFKAYCIHDGKLESIMDEETGLINGKYLDGISNEIGSQFDELLRIGYVET